MLFLCESGVDFEKVKVMNYWEYAEKLNGRLAMLGIIAAIGAYATTGQIIPGVF